MTYRGRVERGVVILTPPAVIAERTEVEIVPVAPTAPPLAGTALERLAGTAKGLPADSAQRHDHYRRERPQ